MTPFLLIVALIPQETTPIETPATYAFRFEQGWKLLTTPNPRMGTGAEVTEGERFFNRVQNPPLPRCEPLAVEGTLALDAQGRWSVRFSRIEYWDAGQRWWIEFGDLRVVARSLTVDRISCTTKEWPARFEGVEKLFLDAYAKLATPRERVETPRLGQLSNADFTKALFVQGAMEEQMVALLFARLNGRALDALSAEDIARYPARVRKLAERALARLTAQCRGEIAPTEARATKDRMVREADWRFDVLAVPGFEWEEDRSLLEARQKRVEEARRALNDLWERTKGQVFSESEGRRRREEFVRLREEWRQAVRSSRDNNANSGVETPEVAPAKKAKAAQVPEPKICDPGAGRYSFKEDLKTADGVVTSSDVEARGIARGQAVVFFDCASGGWRVCEAQYETWWRATVTRR